MSRCTSSRWTWPSRARGLYLEGKLDVDPFISHHISLDEVNRGFELMERQAGIRSVITLS